MLTLRGHHLICLVAFKGEGYSKAFALNFHKLQKLYLGKPAEKIKVVAGPDMACAKCPHLRDQTCVSPTDSPNARILALDRQACKLLKIKPGIYSAGALHHKLRLVKRFELESFCHRCSWYPLATCLDIIETWQRR